MSQRCLKEFKVKYTEKENMGGQRLISISSVRSGSEALAVSSEENYCSHFYRQEKLGCCFKWGLQGPFLAERP